MQAEVELAMPALEKLGGELKNIVDVDSFSSDGQRTVVVIDKMIATPPKYPRQAGRPQKKPLWLDRERIGDWKSQTQQYLDITFRDWIAWSVC